MLYKFITHDPMEVLWPREAFTNGHRKENVASQSRHRCCQAVNTTDGHRAYGKKLLDAGSL